MEEGEGVFINGGNSGKERVGYSCNKLTNHLGGFFFSFFAFTFVQLFTLGMLLLFFANAI